MQLKRSRVLTLLSTLLLGLGLVLAGQACKQRGAGAVLKDNDAAPQAADAGGGEQKINLFQPGNRYAQTPADHYTDKVAPILGKRCVVCHSCSESPCQLKLDSYKGLMRGLSKIDAYGPRVFKDLTDTSNIDRFSLEQFREHGFKPVVVQEQGNNAQTNNTAGSILFRALSAGRSETNKPGPTFDISRTESLKKGNFYKYECPQTTKDYNDFIIANPQAGMPFAMPWIPQDEFETLRDWIAQGSPGPSAAVEAAIKLPQQSAMTKGAADASFKAWEEFFFTGPQGSNANPTAVSLVGRYFYEHTYLANIHFAENPGEYYQLVRSRTPPGREIDEIFTESPYDDPGILSRVYIRLKKVTTVIPRKVHITLELSDKHLAWYSKLFYPADKPWHRSSRINDPGYADWNPFVRFEAIPAEIRYRYILANTKIMIDHMSRGPVCVGNMATYVVADQFWSTFLDPSVDPGVQDPKLGLKNWDHLGKKNVLANRTYRKAWEASLRKILAAKGKRGLSVSDLWNGDKDSDFPQPSAAVTMVRHETNETVYFGLHGGMPETMWVGSYNMMERLYYNLVVAFRAYGDAKHKISTWSYQAHVRQEGEDLFLSFLPEAARADLRAKWTNGVVGTARQAIALEGTPRYVGRPPGEEGLTKETFIAKVVDHLGPQVLGDVKEVMNDFPHLDAPADVPQQITNENELEMGLRALKLKPKGYARYFPNITYLRVSGGGKDYVYSILANREYLFHNVEFGGAYGRNEKEDTLSIMKGINGNYVNLFLDIPMEQAAQALSQLAAVSTGEEWDAFEKQYGVTRDKADANGNSAFWAFVDWIHDYQQKNNTVEAGIVDLREYGYEGERNGKVLGYFGQEP